MDVRSPFIVDLASLSRQEGASTERERTLDAPVNLGTELIGVPEGSPFKIRPTLQSISEGTHVGGSVAVHVVGECIRYVRRFKYDVDKVVDELAFYLERRLVFIEEGDEETKEFPVTEDGHVDVEPVSWDAIILSLPFTSLCEPDCQGLCSDYGKWWEELPNDHFHPLSTNDDDPSMVLEAKPCGDMEQ